VLLEALDESLKSIFGESAAYAILYHLGMSGSFGLKEIFEHPQDFTRALKEMFGEVGAEVVGGLLVEELREKLGIDREENAPGSLEDFFYRLKIACSERASKPGKPEV